MAFSTCCAYAIVLPMLGGVALTTELPPPAPHWSPPFPATSAGPTETLIMTFPPSGKFTVPAAGFWLTTLPTGTVGCVWFSSVTVKRNPDAVRAAIAASRVMPTTFGTVAKHDNGRGGEGGVKFAVYRAKPLVTRTLEMYPSSPAFCATDSESPPMVTFVIAVGDAEPVPVPTVEPATPFT